MSQFLCINGEFKNSAEPVLSSTNRGFRYGDSLFESMRITNGNVQFLGDHFKRLRAAASVLRYNLSVEFNEAYVASLIGQLKEKNNIQNEARVRLSVFRNEGGYYTPSTNDVSFLIEMVPMAEMGYTLNLKGLTVDIYSEIKKSRNSLAGFKNGNALIYIMAGLHKKQNNLDDCVLLNDKDNVIEASSSNVFAVKNGVLYTPPLEDGCVDGVMRRQILDLAKQNRTSVYEIALAFNVMLNADELFLTDAVNGIRWIGAYKSKRYFNNTSKLFTEKLNQRARELV